MNFPSFPFLSHEQVISGNTQMRCRLRPLLCGVSRFSHRFHTALSQHRCHGLPLCQQRGCSTAADRPKVVALHRRAVLKISGDDRVELLQGLVTNDMRHLDSMCCMYALLLDVRGRLQFDLILHQVQAVAGHQPHLLVDVDRARVQQLRKTLMMYGLRKRFSVSVCDDILPVTVFQRSTVPKFDGDPFSAQCVTWAPDPRLSQLGYRAVVADGERGVEKLSQFLNATACHEESYERHRFELGVAEGQDEMPAGKALPLQFNADYMNGVSFHKGCYLGQELTARTHHTGVVRKRLMPIKLVDGTDILLPAVDSGSVQYGAKLQRVQKPHRTMGKLVAVRKFDNDVIGLALCDVDGIEKDPIMLLHGYDGDVTFSAKAPEWWPQTEITGRVTGFQPRGDLE